MRQREIAFFEVDESRSTSPSVINMNTNNAKIRFNRIARRRISREYQLFPRRSGAQRFN